MTLYYTLTDMADGEAILRGMLVRALGTDALRRTASGKPFAEGCAPFSFARCGALAVLLADEADCGVDAEPLDGNVDIPPVEALTENELSWLQDQLHNYMTLWTRKQAAKKAAGDMGVPERSFDVLGRDNSVTLGGTRWFLGSYALEGWVVSWASRSLDIPELQYVDLNGSKEAQGQ